MSKVVSIRLSEERIAQLEELVERKNAKMEETFDKLNKTGISRDELDFLFSRVKKYTVREYISELIETKYQEMLRDKELGFDNIINVITLEQFLESLQDNAPEDEITLEQLLDD